MVPKPPKKAKKPLETTLGKASTIPKEAKNFDLSHVRKPIDTSLFGLRQVLSLFKTGTEEVQNYITFECDLMYECRICRTIFRSLANFILHKRNYCRERYNPLGFPNDDDDQESSSVVHSMSKDKHNDNATSKKPETSCITNIVDRLRERQEVVELNRRTINEDFSKEKEKNDHKECVKSITAAAKNIVLEEIPTSSAAVFQTFCADRSAELLKQSEFMKTEVMEIHSILDENEAVLDSSGKICEFETNKISKIPRGSLFCTECNIKFSTKKTLSHHLKYKHNRTQLVYICPDCKDPFANAWCVYRHLMKVHRKTSQQIRRLRQQIHNSVVRKDHCPKRKKDNGTSLTVEEPDEENQWMTNIEDSDFQMCGGCGKRFERKAALHSHVTMCLKRMAVCNTIKENNAKKREEETKGGKANGKDKATSPPGAKGASKRKPYLLRTYKPRQLVCDQDCDENANSGVTEVDCCEGYIEKTAEKPCSTTATSENKGVIIPNSTSHDSVLPPSTNIFRESTSETKHLQTSNEKPASIKIRTGSRTMSVDRVQQVVNIESSFSDIIKDEDTTHKWTSEDIRNTAKDTCVTCTMKTTVPSASTIENTQTVSNPEKTLQLSDADFYEESPDVILLEDGLNELDSVNKESSRQNTLESTMKNKVRSPPAKDRQGHTTDTTQCEYMVLSDSTTESMLKYTDSVAKSNDTRLLKSETITSDEKYTLPFGSMTSEMKSCFKDSIHVAGGILENKVPSVSVKSNNTMQPGFVAKNRTNEDIGYNEDTPGVKDEMLSEITEDTVKGKNYNCSFSLTPRYNLNDSKNVEDIVATTRPSLMKTTIDSVSVFERKCSLLTTEFNLNDSKIKVESLVPDASSTLKEQDDTTITKSKDMENNSPNTDDTKVTKVPVSFVDTAWVTIPSSSNSIAKSNYRSLPLVNQSSNTDGTRDENIVQIMALKDKGTEDCSNKMDASIEEKEILSLLCKSKHGSDSVANKNNLNLVMLDKINTNHMLDISPKSVAKIKVRPIVEMLEGNGGSKVNLTIDNESILPKKKSNVVMKKERGLVPSSSDSDLARENTLSIISISNDSGIIRNKHKNGAIAEKPGVLRKLYRDRLGRFSGDSITSMCVPQKHKATRSKIVQDDNKNIDKCSKRAKRAECRKIFNDNKYPVSPKKSDEVDNKSPRSNSSIYKENERSSMIFNECVVNLRKFAADETSSRSRTPKICSDSDGRDSSPELRGFPHEEPESLKAVSSLIQAVTRDWAESDPGVGEIKSEWVNASEDMKININEPSETKNTEVLKRACSRDRNQNQKHKSPKRTPEGQRSKAQSSEDKNKILAKTKCSPRKSREQKIVKNESTKTRKRSLPGADKNNCVMDNIGTRIGNYKIVKDKSTGNTFNRKHPKREEVVLKQQVMKKEGKSAMQKRGLKRKHTARTIQCQKEKKSLRHELELAFGGIVQKALPYMDVQLLQCKSCQKTFSKLTKLINHMSAHFSWFRYQCSNCTLVSYSKKDCIAHVIEHHRASQEYLSSMVLPIPSWKTLLMSHDFRELEEREDNTGKHIDEIIVGYNEEPICIDDDDDEVICSTSNETEQLAMTPHPSIDVSLSDDTQQVELPTEIYSCEPYELLNLVDCNFGDRSNETSDDFSVVEDFTELADDTGDFFGDLFDAPVLNPEPYLIEDTTRPDTADVKGELSISTKHVKREPICLLPTDRPMRNRIRSEKRDFVYDMKAVKLNKVRAKSKNGVITATTTTSTKSTNPSRGLNSIKVYTKKEK